MRARVLAEYKLAWARPFLVATPVAKTEASLRGTLTKMRAQCAALTEELDRLIAKTEKDD